MLIYRPGSEDVTTEFFTELSDVLDRLVTFVDPVLIVGDINIRLDRPTNPNACQFTDIVAAHGLCSHVTSATHNQGGALDIVVTRDELPAPIVEVLDVGLSDHRLLQWSTVFTRPSPVYSSVTSRPWSKLDPAVFRSAPISSSLCRPDCWTELGVGDLAQLYNDEITAVLDQTVPARTMMCRRRPSDEWFDQDCRVAKRRVRQLERATHRVDLTDAAAVAAAITAWTTRRRAYRDLLRNKREAFWKYKVDAERSSPRRLWRTIDELMGRGRAPSACCRRG